MKALNNVAVSDDYSAAATIENFYSGIKLDYLVANNSAIMQVQRRTGVGSGMAGWTEPFLVFPSVGSFADAVGVRFKNAVAGSVARVVAQLWEKSDPLPSGVNPFAGTLSASGQVTNVTNPAGSILAYGGPAAPTGYVLCDGSVYDGTSTTYAALWAAIGATYGGVQAAFNVPDLRGRVIAGLGTHGDVNALGDNDGVALANRSPAHNSTNSLTLPNHAHAVTDPGHNHDYNLTGGAGSQPRTAGAGVFTRTASGANGFNYDNTTGITVGNPTTNPAIGGSIGPGGTLPIDRPAYLTLNYIISLG